MDAKESACLFLWMALKDGPEPAGLMLETGAKRGFSSRACGGVVAIRDFLMDLVTYSRD